MTTTLSHEAWLAARKLGVSGTDVGVLLGLNRYKSEEELIMDKLGLGPGFAGNAATRAGTLLEPFIARAWSERTSTPLELGVFTVSDIDPRYIGTPDYLTPDSVLEIKTGVEKTWQDGCPKSYEVQCRWYMLLTKKENAHLVACIVPKDRKTIPPVDLLEWVKNQPHREFEFQRDLAWEAQAQEVAQAFLLKMDALRENRGLIPVKKANLGLPPTYDLFSAESDQQSLPHTHPAAPAPAYPGNEGLF